MGNVDWDTIDEIYLVIDHITTGTVERCPKRGETNARREWLSLVNHWQAEGYSYLQLSDDSGCAFKAGSTINISLE